MAGVLFGRTPEELAEFESLRYNPIHKGLKSLSFTVRAPHLEKQLNDQLSFGEIKNLHYIVTWSLAKGYDIKIAGLPKGFEQLRANLRGTVAAKLDFLIPSNMIQHWTGYTFEKVNNSKGLLLKGKDETGKMGASVLDIQINKEGLVEETKALSPGGVVTSKMQYAKHPWTQGKYLVTQTVVETQRDGRKTTMETSITYRSIQGIGLPQKIATTTVTALVSPEKNNEIREEQAFHFNSYKINQTP